MVRARLKKVVAVGAATAVASLGGVVAATSAHASDPGGNCSVSVSGTPGNVTFALHVTFDGCGLPVRAWGDCELPEVLFGDWTATGGTVYSTGATSTADCSPGIGVFGTDGFWGYDVYSGGKWVRVNMNTTA
jgi:hypothetical protein